MAINVTQSPSTNTSAHNPVVWKFQFTALGVSPVVKSMIYYLADSSNNRISEIYTWTPQSTSEVLPVDMSKVLVSLLKTSFPSYGAIMTDSTAVKAVKIRYRENDYNTTTCTDTPGTLTDTSVIYAWNVKQSLENQGLFTWTNPRTGAMMNSYPRRMYWGYDTEPYVWFAGAGTVRITFYNSAGSSLGTTTHTFTGTNTAKYAPLDYSDLGISSLPYSALLEVNEGLGYLNHYISYSACTCRETFTGVMFLDPLGGRSFAPIKCSSENSVQRTVSEVLKYTNTILSNENTGFRPRAEAQIKVQIPLGAETYDRQFAQALIGSPGHHLLYANSAGVRTWHKAILSGSGITTVQKGKETTLELTFQLSDDKSGQTFDI